jgi:hypothetical protein
VDIEGRTEAANATRFALAFGNDLRYVVQGDDWIVWDGARWVRDVSGVLVQKKGIDFASGLWGDVSVAVKERADEKTQIVRFVERSNSGRSISNVVTLARTPPRSWRSRAVG